MKIAIAQINPTIGDLPGNAQKILEMCQQAVLTGVRLLLTPELSICGYPPRDLLLNPTFVEAMDKTLQKLAEDLPTNLAVLVGTVVINSQAHITGGKNLFNSIALLENGKIQQIFHKRLLPTYDVFDEKRYFEPGIETNYFTLDDVKIGVTICEDLWNDEEFWGKRSYAVNPIADLANLDVDLIVNLSASPYTVSKQHLREAMLKHSAVNFQQPIIYTNQVGGNDDLIFDGRSFALNKQGEIVCRAKGFISDFLTVEFNSNKQDLELGDISPVDESENEEIWNALVLGVKDYVGKCRFSKVLLGLSGGVDSALVAAIATAALGKENVLGVLMPSPYSSEHSISDALALADNLDIKTQILPIGELMQGFDNSLGELFTGTEFGIAEENLQSRIRGNLLMAISNKFGYLLLSTGNKSEVAVGYCTLYGDMNGGLSVIADVPKTRVYSLCQWLNCHHQQEIIPQNILTKAPSAELKPGQVDQDSLPAYEILDDILDRLIHQHQSTAEIIIAGHDPAIVNRVLQLLSRAEFKRRQAAPGLKITDRAFGTGWRMPIASSWLALKNSSC
ncbi:NAD+ synthase [Dolichospermum sp. ST_sed1]|nr:NAD+ synthase [Dolichospermum sp. ST_sed1]MDD1427772.1 NAD+ synthase [Dolichospermum sp. ST_sed9]MDD1430209.1 NAD+ synthase [Dolichospermum sp. ST_sed6]MDD1438407.1 NAD+ synthase [Dolichospermum sp. ST_sed10]MDD1443434.1 NAD+ synthase [Dolichospermum sp. ST_sed3]MDD1446682.1 NAD+ synthase [Dolichospermum sp. ST_sed8]MDD1454742.1 NAD+ synthase [Dolichospermum sp. ST_sed7]MDD1463080.1 NAD+ synthase [Dolichospermum sp. ST_sed2]MDD1467398.1 NAD+ synthase [Dolichospermum sp. ST_sed5]MDD14719